MKTRARYETCPRLRISEKSISELTRSVTAKQLIKCPVPYEATKSATNPTELTDWSEMDYKQMIQEGTLRIGMANPFPKKKRADILTCHSSLLSNKEAGGGEEFQLAAQGSCRSFRDVDDWAARIECTLASTTARCSVRDRW